MAASAPARLITIPISHYCEKARWALDRAGDRLPRGAPRPGRPSGRLAPGGRRRHGPRAGGAPRACSRSRPTSSPTPTATPSPARGCTPRTPSGAPRSSPSSATSTPTSGPRAGAGCTSTSSPSATSGAPTTARASPRGSGARSRCCSARCRATSAICSPSGPRPGREAGAAVQRTFDAVAARLDDGRRYLCGDAFTAADLAFAALAAPVLVPPRVRRPAAPARRAAAGHGRGGARLPRPSRPGPSRCRLFREER